MAFKSNKVRRLYYKLNKRKLLAQIRELKYGITDIQFISMVKKQNNRCAICGLKETLVDWRTGEVKALSVDHNHKTNKIRKLLCQRCNVGLGIFKDSVKLLQRALAYLSEEGTGNGI